MGENKMQVIQTLKSISVNTDDINVFHYFKNLISKNFSKVVGRKNKILSFFIEDEIPQRRYFLKVLDQSYRKSTNEGIQNLQDAHFKTFKLNFEQNNMLKTLLFIEVQFAYPHILMKLNANEKLFISYMKNYFKNHIRQNNTLFMLEYKDESTLKLFEAFAEQNEHLKYRVNFNINYNEYKNFRQKFHNKENTQWKFNALAKLFSPYFATLECTPQNNLNEIRQKYLVLVKLYHPDFHHNKSTAEKMYCREQFEKIQIAYDNLKALYKNKS